MIHLHLHGGYRTYDVFEESKVKRGQPENAGEFAKADKEHAKVFEQYGYKHAGGGLKLHCQRVVRP